MKKKQYASIKNLDLQQLNNLTFSNPTHPHIHTVDMPYRLSSIWQDVGVELATWEENEQLLAWAVFQPAWWNFDLAIHPSQRGTVLEKEIAEWGVAEMQAYSNRTGWEFWGSVEWFESDPYAQQSADILTSLNFKRFEWSTVRLKIDFTAGEQALPTQPPASYHVRQLNGIAEVDRYVEVHRATFGSEVMTRAWRSRSIQHPDYLPELDLVIADSNDRPVGFCVCWLKDGVGQIEPLGVHPDFHRKGLGQALELEAIQRMQDLGATSILIDHTSFNDKAISLSKKSGFKQIDNALRYYVDIKAQ